MSTTPRPRSARRLHEVEHLARLGDAERRRRLVEDHELRVPHHRLARPRRPGAGRPRGRRPVWRTERSVVTDERLSSVSRGALLHRRLVEHDAGRVLSRPRYMFCDDVEVVAEREVLVDDLDPERGRVARAVDRRPARPRSRSRPRRRRGSGDALDQRRLAGAVVADERHHLARAHLEVDAERACTAPKVFVTPCELEERASISASARTGQSGWAGVSSRDAPAPVVPVAVLLAVLRGDSPGRSRSTSGTRPR